MAGAVIQVITGDIGFRVRVPLKVDAGGVGGMGAEG
jgi:hypothetical protein